MYKKLLSLVLFCSFLPLLLRAQSGTAQPQANAILPLERIFFKPFITGARPGDPSISPNSKFIMYDWDEQGGHHQRHRMMNADGSNDHILRDTLVGETEWSPDGQSIACTREGDLFITDTGFAAFTRITKDEHPNGLSWSPDGKWLAFSADDKIMALPNGKMGIVQLASPATKEASLQMRMWTPDGRHVVFTEYKRGETKEFLIPRYVDKEVTTRSVKSGNGVTKIGVAPVDTGATVWIKLKDQEKYFNGDIDVSPDSKSILVERYSIDRTKREIYVADLDSGKTTLVYEEKDPAWVEGAGYDAHWMPDGKHIVYTSEREGWNQLYLVTPDGKNTNRITEGDWEIKWFGFNPPGNTIYLLANKDDHAQWQLFALDVQAKSLRRISSREGTYDAPVLSKDGSFITARYSDVAKPDELVRVPTSSSLIASSSSMKVEKEVQLTNTVPKEFGDVSWTVPEIVHFKSRDNTMIPAFIYKPAHFDAAKKYPAVVFVHGAGYLQNVYRGWSYYYREFMFHTRLTQLGYVVYEVEYRGSAGLGREFRTDVYMHLGGKDLDDEVDGISYLANLGYIDPARVGIYGGSYGGFMTLMAMFQTDKFACGAALRAVTSWENYYNHNQWYTGARLGKPEEHAEAYRISSPITFADSLKKPLLILHGMMDDNVFFQDAVQLVNKLQKSKKKFDLMMYPEESHAFTQPESWYDEYSRIEEFFNKNLKP